MSSVNLPVGFTSVPLVGVGQPSPSLSGPFNPEVMAVAASRGQAENLPKVLAIARELFPGPVRMVATEDPEIEGDWHIEVEVESLCGLTNLDEAVSKELEWMRRVLDCTLPRADVFRLVVHYKGDK